MAGTLGSDEEDAVGDVVLNQTLFAIRPRFFSSVFSVFDDMAFCGLRF